MWRWASYRRVESDQTMLESSTVPWVVPSLAQRDCVPAAASLVRKKTLPLTSVRSVGLVSTWLMSDTNPTTADNMVRSSR